MNLRLSLIIAPMIISGSLFATPITGRLILNGLTLTGDSLTTVDFNYAGCGSTTPICTAPPASSATTGTFNIGFGSTLSFLPFVGQNGSVQSFNSAQAPTGVDLGAGAIANFIVIPTPGAAQISLSLRKVNAGSFLPNNCASAPAAGQTCTPVLPGGAVSPLELSNSTGIGGTGDGTGLNSHAQFSVLVDAINLNTGEKSTGTGTFSTDFAGYSYQTLLQAALNGSVITTGIHGDFTVVFSAVPEPSSMSFGFCGIALIGAASLLGRLRKAKG